MATRILLFASIHADQEQEFEEAFARVRQRVATVDGHIRDELLRERDAPGRYVLVSEWESKDVFLAWLRSPFHEEMTSPMQPYFARPSDTRFYDLQVA
jgi:heme oxygenase (mycobilin-producing)